MAKKIFVAIELSRTDLKKLYKFRLQAFDDQLLELERQIHTICRKLTKMKKDDPEWVIAWQEHGLTGTKSRYLSVDQKAKLKSVMKKLTLKYPRLTIVCGTILTKRSIDLQDFEKTNATIKQLTEAYDFNKKFNLDNKKFEKHRGAILELTKPVPEYYVIRNTCYIFLETLFTEENVVRHDKINPFEETTFFTHAVFRPGIGRGHRNYINRDISVEICFEHSLGIIAKKVGMEPIALVQLIISDSTDFIPKHQVSPYAVHIDSMNKTRLITEVRKEDVEIELYSYDFLANPSTFNEVKPQTAREYLMEYLCENMGQNQLFCDNLEQVSQDRKKNSILTTYDYLILMRKAVNLYNQYSGVCLVDEYAFIEKDKINTILKPKLIEFLRKLSSYDRICEERDLLEKFLSNVVKMKDKLLLKILINQYHHVLDYVLFQDNFIVFLIESRNIALFNALFENRPLSSFINKPINSRGDTVLHVAARERCVDIIRRILKEDVNVYIDIDKKNGLGQTALDVAEASGFPQYNRAATLIKEYRDQKKPVEKLSKKRESCSHWFSAIFSRSKKIK